jgi:hypothetical protein
MYLGHSKPGIAETWMQTYSDVHIHETIKPHIPMDAPPC